MLSTTDEVRYLLNNRLPMLRIWNVNDLTPASEPVAMVVKEASIHFQIYDCGSSLVATPKDFVAGAYTSNDALQTARAMARLLYKRGWHIECAGMQAMERAVWVEWQHLEAKQGKALTMHYVQTYHEWDLYINEVQAGRE